MTDEQADIFQAANAIRNNQLSPQALQLFEKIIDRGDCAACLSSILSCERGALDVSQVMQQLESLAEFAQPTACIFMAHLWSHADDLLLHAVCDAIDLWISNCSSPKLTDQLMQLAAAEKDTDTRRHYETLVEVRHDRGNS